MLGRYQPWHQGHTELFKRAHKKTGQVAIMVRDTGESYHSRKSIIESLSKENFMYNKDYIIMDVPNIVDISYGRDVGYTFTQHDLGEEIHKISATKLRHDDPEPERYYDWMLWKLRQERIKKNDY